MGTAPTLKLTEMAGFIIVHATVLKSSVIKADILDGPCRLYFALAKTDNLATDFLKLWNNTNPTGGTTDPDYVFKTVSDVWNPIPLDPDGVVLDNGLSFGADDAGGTVLGTDPDAFEVMLVARRGAS